MEVSFGGLPIPSLLRLGFFLFLSLPLLILSFCQLTFAEEFTVDSHPANVWLPPGQLVEGSPGSKPGSMMACNRVLIRGVSRLRNVNKYAHSLRVRAVVDVEDPVLRVPTLDVCFHRNASIGVGMCPEKKWVKVAKGSWVQSMSPYENMILDTRMPRSRSSKPMEVSTEEVFLFHRVVFLVTGIVMMVLAHWLSESVVFYYGSAMGIGVLLVMLMVLFQGMKLLPTGRKSSLAIFTYSSVVGVATFLLRYISGLLRSVLVEIGISEDMHNPLAVFLGFCLVLAGAWLGFWSVRKLVLAEDGSIDASVAYFVEWTILIFAGVMILESSLDTFLVLEALAFGIGLRAITKTKRKWKFLLRLYRQITRCFGRNRSSPSKYFQSDCQFHSPMTESELLRFQTRHCPLGPCTSPIKGLAKTSLQMPAEQEIYYSTFHNTPDRKRLSEEEWKTFTRDSTKHAMEELFSSPDFGRWVAANADRIRVTPTKDRTPDKAPNRFYWF